MLAVVAIVFLLNNFYVLSKPLEQTTDATIGNSEEEPVDVNAYYGNLSSAIIRKIQKCDKDIESMELCMRCAKVTKSEIVYPMCCANEENVKDWCHAYIYFGNTE